jgi:hypothetical protein
VGQVQSKAFKLDERRSFRHPMTIVTRMRELGGGDVPVVLRNLSTVGFSGDCNAPLAVPTLVVIQLPPLGELRARLRWASDGTLGGEFLTRLDEDALEQVLAAVPNSIVDSRLAG